MILQINVEGKKEHLIDGISHIHDEGRHSYVGCDMDLRVGHTLLDGNTEGKQYDEVKIINCRLSPKYGDKDYKILLQDKNRVTAWVLNDEGKTLYRIF